MGRNRVTVIGGGTGLAVLLRGLKQLPIDIKAIVTMTDNGASSGRLRRDYGILPPGDIRQCLVSLADDEKLLTRLFNYRFEKGRGLSGHSFGNLFLVALTKITGNFEQAISESSRILAIRGRVVPSTLKNVNLGAELKNGQIVLGEKDIPIMGHRSAIKRVFCVPNRVSANPEALEALKKADLILIGPGSLYTSIIPNFLIKSITRTILLNKKAKKVFICNISTERGETEHYTVEDHIDALLRHSDPLLITHCLVNSRIINKNGHEGRLGSISNITTKNSSYRACKIVKKDLVDNSYPLFHDPVKLTKAIKKLFLQ